MADIERDVLQTFLAQLAASPSVGDGVVEALREQLSADKLPKPELLAQTYARASGQAIA